MTQLSNLLGQPNNNQGFNANAGFGISGGIQQTTNVGAGGNDIQTPFDF